MSRRSVAALLGAGLLGALGAGSCPKGGGLVQEVVVTDGFVEPHTPGAGDADEMPATPTVQALLGTSPDLNRVHTLRTRITKPGGAPPRVVLILIPGFLGGAATFAPLARDLVREMNGQLEVWVVDRRPNQLEDRRGGLHAKAAIDTASGPADVTAALEDAMRFYFSPLDLDEDGTPDPAFELPDALGGTSSARILAQDDMRFAAFWGIDTYVRDWKLLVDEARALVGEQGLVLFGGHSMGTSWAGAFAAYDFDPGPGVLAAHELIDGLLLLEGGGLGAGSEPPTQQEYLDAVADLAAPGGSDVYLPNVLVFPTPALGSAAEIAGLAGTHAPDDPAILQKGSLFGGFPATLLFGAPMTNQALVGFFIDDDFTTMRAFSASVGFSDNGWNRNNILAPLVEGDFYIADYDDQSTLRTWKNFDDPTLPSCPPASPTTRRGEAGCAIRDNGPKPAPGAPGAPWGLEREVVDIDELLRIQFENGNFAEWYFVSGRVGLDFSFGRDSSALGDESLLAVTRNASVDVPVLCIGGSNGLAETETDFAGYLGSIATPPADQEIVILEGYAHLDVLLATRNETVPPVVDWVARLLQRKLLETF